MTNTYLKDRGGRAPLQREDGRYLWASHVQILVRRRYSPKRTRLESQQLQGLIRVVATCCSRRQQEVRYNMMAILPVPVVGISCFTGGMNYLLNVGMEACCYLSRRSMEDRLEVDERVEPGGTMQGSKHTASRSKPATRTL
jgi:hypothetical protein